MSGGTITPRLEWTTPVTAEIIPELERRKAAVLRAIGMVFESFALKVRAYAVKNAPWQDRTAHARQGLRTQVDTVGAVFTLTLFHTMDYGIWLEIANDGRYAVILKTMEKQFPLLMELIRKTVDRAMQGVGG